MQQFLVLLWATIRKSPVFVAAYSAAGGAVVSMLQDELASGRIDWSHSGLNKLMGYAAMAAVAAVVHLYAPVPGTNPKK